MVLSSHRGIKGYRSIYREGGGHVVCDEQDFIQGGVEILTLAASCYRLGIAWSPVRMETFWAITT